MASTLPPLSRKRLSTLVSSSSSSSSSSSYSSSSSSCSRKRVKDNTSSDTVSSLSFLVPPPLVSDTTFREGVIEVKERIDRVGEEWCLVHPGILPIIESYLMPEWWRSTVRWDVHYNLRVARTLLDPVNVDIQRMQEEVQQHGSETSTTTNVGSPPISIEKMFNIRLVDEIHRRGVMTQRLTSMQIRECGLEEAVETVRHATTLSELETAVVHCRQLAFRIWASTGIAEWNTEQLNKKEKEKGHGWRYLPRGLSLHTNSSSSLATTNTATTTSPTTSPTIATLIVEGELSRLVPPLHTRCFASVVISALLSMDNQYTTVRSLLRFWEDVDHLAMLLPLTEHSLSTNRFLSSWLRGNNFPFTFGTDRNLPPLSHFHPLQAIAFYCDLGLCGIASERFLLHLCLIFMRHLGSTLPLYRYAYTLIVASAGYNSGVVLCERSLALLCCLNTSLSPALPLHGSSGDEDMYRITLYLELARRRADDTFSAS